MDNLRAVIKNLFCYVSIEGIINGEIQYDTITEDTFLQLGSGYITRYSNDELKNMYYYLENEFQWQNRKLKGESLVLGESKNESLNVFDALVVFDYAVLIEENGVPLCQYMQLLRWRDMITILEEDLFIASFFAFKDNLTGKVRKNFFWKPVIGHNNQALNNLVARGVAENHFHLKGSAPQFHLSWISIMNQIDKKKFDDTFRQYEKNRLQKNLNLSSDYAATKLTDMWKQAALIRVFLFSVLQDDCLDWGDVYVPYFLLSKFIKQDKMGEGIKKEQLVRIEDFMEELGERVDTLRQWYSEMMVKKLLRNTESLNDYVGIIQGNINRFREEYGKCSLDYMICEKWLARNGEKNINGPLSGERWFLYRMFLAVNQKEKRLEPYINWFYLYLVLKASIRRELVQTNVNVGFDNFLKYQDRKDVFVEDSVYEQVYIRMAVRDTIYNQHIETLEARVAPKMDWKSNLKMIQKYDKYILGEDELSADEKEELLDTYFYVIHFVKTSERVTLEHPCLEECRHSQKRREVKIQARAIAELRESGVAEVQRIKGIDACSPEIWCRPEVFAQAFRFLKNHSVTEEMNGEECLKNLSITYHVGEDFLDVIDGLRAIDEAVNFLNLRCGDRLGHALALGVDIDDWYESKSYRILINKMGYLDNLVWLYAKLRKYNVEGCDEVRAYIEKRFHEYFGEIYENNMDKDTMQCIFQKARDFFKECGIRHSYNHEKLNFDINEYYNAWKLRGDNPQLYRDGFFRLRGEIVDEWDVYSVNKNFPQNYKIRYNPETALLYYMYHFVPDVKILGDQIVEVRVNYKMIDAIKKVRRIMQQEISKIGIGIETNPSSNYLIGTFRRYDMHPIIKWYNFGLVTDPKTLEQCPQMQVSINTDDQGVFSTYIENEYAYLALALEKKCDEKGEFIYNRTMILQWLENIRKMGIDQSFYHKE